MSVRVTPGPRNLHGRRWLILMDAATKRDHWQSMSATTPELYQIRDAINAALGKTVKAEETTNV